MNLMLNLMLKPAIESEKEKESKLQAGRKRIDQIHAVPKQPFDLVLGIFRQCNKNEKQRRRQVI